MSIVQIKRKRKMAKMREELKAGKAGVTSLSEHQSPPLRID